MSSGPCISMSILRCTGVFSDRTELTAIAA